MTEERKKIFDALVFNLIHVLKHIIGCDVKSFSAF